MLVNRMMCCCRQPHNRKALQKLFAGAEPKLIGFATKVTPERLLLADQKSIVTYIASDPL